MFDVTAQLVNNQDEINGLDKILNGKNSGTHLSLIGDETIINLKAQKTMYSRILCCASGGSFNILSPRSLEEQGCRNPIREKLQRL